MNSVFSLVTKSAIGKKSLCSFLPKRNLSIVPLQMGKFQQRPRLLPTSTLISRNYSTFSILTEIPQFGLSKDALEKLKGEGFTVYRSVPDPEFEKQMFKDLPPSELAAILNDLEIENAVERHNEVKQHYFGIYVILTLLWIGIILFVHIGNGVLIPVQQEKAREELRKARELGPNYR